MEQNIPNPQKKFTLLKKMILAFFFLLVLLFTYAYIFIHKRITINEYPIIVETLPSNFNGLKIVHFSDIHFGVSINEAELEKIIQEINITNPDIVVFSGDLFDININLSDKNIDFLKKTLLSINAKLKKYAILGDNDYKDKETYIQIMEHANFKVLEDQNELIFFEGKEPIQIAGISSIQKNDINLENTFKSDASSIPYKILIAHEPEIIDKLGNTKVDLILSGHSLGGLIYIPYIGEILKKPYTKDYQKGYYKKENTEMFVSSGLGTEEIRLRLFNPPSINLYRFYNYK